MANDYKEGRIDKKDNPNDLRLKKCGICGKEKLIHKYDAYCSESCRNTAANRRRATRSIFY